MVFIIENRFSQNYNEDFETEDNDCIICDIVDKYSFEIAFAESLDDLEFMLHELVKNAFEDGYMAALQDDVDVKNELIDGMYKR